MTVRIRFVFSSSAGSSDPTSGFLTFVVVDLPEDRLAVELEVAEIVLAVGVVLECTRRVGTGDRTQLPSDMNPEALAAAIPPRKVLQRDMASILGNISVE
jgi:hypothetical protein